MGLLEREIDLGMLDSLLEKARLGSGQIVLVRGEAGIGKTALVRRFIQSVDDDESFVLTGGCDDFLAPRPLGPIWDIGAAEPALAEALLTGDRNRIFGAFYDLLTRSLRPTTVVIEDAHWADDATLDLISFVGRRIESSHGLLILTYRDGEVGGEHPLRHVLGDLPYGAVTNIQLRALSKEAVAQLVGDESTASEVWDLTAGNPFFVSELLTSPADSVPPSIRDAIRGRLVKLSSGARDLVELTAVAPGSLELAVVNKILGDVTDAIEACEKAGILELDSHALTFRHELARRVVEGDLATIRRMEMNRAVLEALEMLDLDVTRKAHHARESGDSAAIVWLLPKAAKQAADLGAHREAAAWLRELEPHLDEMTVEERADHYDLWAHEEHMVSTREGIVERAIALRRELGDPGSLGRTIMLASRIAWEHDRNTLAMELAEEAVEVLAPVGGEELAMAYATISQLAIGTDEQRAIRYAEEALALAGPQPSRVRLNALTNEGAARMTNHYPDGTDLLEEAFEMAGELGLSLDQFRAAINLAWCHRIHFEPDRSDSWLRAGAEVGRKAEIPTLELHLTAERAALTAMRGEWGAAVTLADEVLAGSSVLAVTVKLASTTMSSIQVRRGDPNALETAREGWELMKTDQVRVAGPLGSVLAEYIWLGGSLEPGLIAELDQLLARSLDTGARPFAGKLAIWLWLAGRLAEIPQGLSEPYVWLGRGDWEQAASFFAARGIPYERAVALSLGGIDAKLEALAIADSLGAVPLASRIRRELESAGVQGVPPRRHRKEGSTSSGGLTARQVEVLGLLAQGLTNLEIADRLFLSKRTVDHHVSAILTALGAQNRSEATHKARLAHLIA